MLSNLLSNLNISKTVPEPVPVYSSLRSQILKLSPLEIGMVPSVHFPNVWGGLMEMGFAHTPVTLVSLGDGTTSLYYGTGSGILGGGNDPTIVQASVAFLFEAEKHIWKMGMTGSFPLPNVGRVQFYVLTFNGIFFAEGSEPELVSNRHMLSPLYSRGQAVITQLRILHQKGGKGSS